MSSEISRLRAELERLQVQLAGCLTAAEGHRLQRAEAVVAAIQSIHKMQEY